MKLDRPMTRRVHPSRRLTRLGGIAHSLGLAAAATVALSSEALALTPQEQFVAALEKIAPFPPAKAKRLCRCTEGNPMVGELRPAYGSQNGLYDYMLECRWPQFDTYAGTVTTFPCSGAFEILPK